MQYYCKTYFGIDRIGASFRIKPTAFNSECTSPPANCHLKFENIDNSFNKTFSDYLKSISKHTNSKPASMDIAIAMIHLVPAFCTDIFQCLLETIHVLVSDADMVVLLAKYTSKTLKVF